MARGAERRALGPPPDLEQVRERSLSLTEAASTTASTAAAEEQQQEAQGQAEAEVEVDQDLSELYRNTTVARELADALAQLSREEDVPMEVLGATMGAFDKVGRMDGVGHVLGSNGWVGRSVDGCGSWLVHIHRRACGQAILRSTEQARHLACRAKVEVRNCVRVCARRMMAV